MNKKIIKLFCESPVIDNTHLNLSNKKKMIGKKNQEEDVQSRYESIKSSKDYKKISVTQLHDNARIEWYIKKSGNFKGKSINGFLLNSDNTIMGEFGGRNNKIDKVPNFMKISYVFVFDEYKGKGYGQALYHSALDLFGGLISDDTLTDASFAMWEKLSKKYPTYVNKYNRDKGDFEFTPSNDLRKDLGSYSHEFIVSKKPIQ